MMPFVPLFNCGDYITIGEIMLRLTPPNYDKIWVANTFDASYGGSEANIALALANLGIDSTFFSVVPNNSLGKSAVWMLRSNDVHCTPMILSTPQETPTHRLGTYYLETSYGIRPSKVTYDRKHSAISEYNFSVLDVGPLLEGFDWLHLSGITPALSPSCAVFILNCLKKAKEYGLTISFDGNFRSKLWTWEEARDYCTQLRNRGKITTKSKRQNKGRAALSDLERLKSSRAMPITQTVVSCRRAMTRSRP